MRRRELIDVAMGRTPADLLIEGGTLVNVSTAELYPADVAVKGNRIAAVGDVSYAKGPETTVVEAKGMHISPGLVDGHLHQYHSYIGVNAFVEALLSHGVTATADAFYGPGIVGGVPAIRFLKEAFDKMPIRLLFLVPVLSWLQNRELGLTPTPGITPEEMLEILDWEGCYGLEEPPYLPVVEHYPEILDLFDETLARRKVITGHAAGISDRQLQAFVAVGACTDHETVTVEDAIAKTRAGMTLFMRHGSGCIDAPELIRAYTEFGIDPRGLGFCADLASPEKLLTEGTIDHAVRIAIQGGVEPVRAIQMATLNVAEVFYAQQDIGSVSAGRYADIVLLNDLESYAIESVIVGGETVYKDGRFIGELPPTEYPESFYGTVTLSKPVTPEDLTFNVDTSHDEVEARVIAVTAGSLVTAEKHERLRVTDGRIEADIDRDILLLAMVDRLGKGTGIGLGFVTGFKLKNGAFASTANAVCENIVIVGTNPDDMAVAANHLAAIGGGKVAVVNGEIVASVGLPLLGLHAEEPLEKVTMSFQALFDEIARMGCDLPSPFSQLEFCFACGEIGDIKLSEEGLVRIDPPEKVDVLVG
jgi:adenine deaminase